MASPEDDKPPAVPFDPHISEPSAASAVAARPQLLPPFEPLLSSPSLPRPSKRKFQESPKQKHADSKHYPTPHPTSSTAPAPTSSSPGLARPTRPGLQRTLSSVSERTPLASVPCVTLPLNGEAVIMGRSSNSSDYQLSANRLISRRHVLVVYRPQTDDHKHPSVFIECLGWNGLKVHCCDKTVELGKGQSFTSSEPQSEIMLYVQDARVIVRWPNTRHNDSTTVLSDATWDDDASPKRSTTPTAAPFDSSPPRLQHRLQSPVSPSPRGRFAPTASTTFLGLPASSPERPSVQIYEDEPQPPPPPADDPSERVHSDPNTQATVAAQTHNEPPASQESNASSALSEPNDDSDHDEENDPIVHSFGMFGANLLPRMASITAGSPERRREPLKTTISPKQGRSFESTSELDLSPVKNHVINQLAFSRLHALPLSTIMKNLPAALKGEDEPPTEPSSEPPRKKRLTEDRLKKLLDDTPCIGEIVREGKDAAGKPLEDEFYYVPDMDSDEGRKNAVENSLGKPGLRAVRKQHKQYYWKRPRH